MFDELETALAAAERDRQYEDDIERAMTRMTLEPGMPKERTRRNALPPTTAGSEGAAPSNDAQDFQPVDEMGPFCRRASYADIVSQPRKQTTIQDRSRAAGKNDQDALHRLEVAYRVRKIQQRAARKGAEKSKLGRKYHHLLPSKQERGKRPTRHSTQETGDLRKLRERKIQAMGAAIAAHPELVELLEQWWRRESARILAVKHQHIQGRSDGGMGKTLPSTAKMSPEEWRIISLYQYFSKTWRHILSETRLGVKGDRRRVLQLGQGQHEDPVTMIGAWHDRCQELVNLHAV